MISLTSPVKTRAHGWPAGGKLLALCLTTLVLFRIEALWVHATSCLLVVGLYLLPGQRFAMAGWRAVRVIWPFVVILGLWHLVTHSVGEGAAIVLRMVTAVALANLVTMTTQLSEFIDVIRWLTRPLTRLGFQMRPLEIAIALVIRFTPVLIAKGQGVQQAWRARSPKRAGWRVILPFTVMALDDADHVAEALRARGGLAQSSDDV